MLFGILLTAQVLICAVMGGLILIQRSEGGALGMGGGPSGFMSARGAGNLLTKLTWVFAALFGANCLGMTVVGNLETHTGSVVDQVDMSKLATAPLAPRPAAASAAASTSSAPSLNDLPLASTPNAGAAPQGNLSTLPGTLPTTALSSSSAAPVVETKMPKPLSPAAAAPIATHPATTHLPSALGSTSVSVAPLGASKTSHSAVPNIFPSASSSASTKPVLAAPSSSASTAPSSAPASTTPASSQ